MSPLPVHNPFYKPNMALLNCNNIDIYGSVATFIGVPMPLSYMADLMPCRLAYYLITTSVTIET